MAIRTIRFTILLFMILFILSNISFVLAVDNLPLLPASYYGEITLDEESINSGEVFSCMGAGETGNVLIYDGTYGVQDSLRLSAEGTSDDEGETVYFCVNNIKANQTVEWTSGDVRNLDLTFSSNGESCVCKETETVTDNSGSSPSGGMSGGSVPQLNTSEDNIDDNENNEVPLVVITESSSDNETEEIVIVENGETMSFQFEKSSITNIQILFNQMVENPIITVNTYNMKPAEITKLPSKNKIYKYLSIEKNFDSNNIGSTIITFEVDVSWFADNNYVPEDIVLLHFKDNKWVELSTKLTGLTNDAYTFEAQANSFSYFAITIKEKSNLLYYVISIIIIIFVVSLFFYYKKTIIKNQKRGKNEN